MEDDGQDSVGSCRSGDESLIQELKEHRIDPHQVTTPIMNTILHISVSFNQMGVSKGGLCPFLLYQANSNGHTPLQEAGKIGSREIVELLLIGVSNNELESQLQADLFKDEELEPERYCFTCCCEKRPLCRCKAADGERCRTFGLVNGANESPLFLAVEGGFLDIAQHILQHFLSAPCCGSNDMNALHAAMICTHHGQVFEYRAPDLSGNSGGS